LSARQECRHAADDLTKLGAIELDERLCRFRALKLVAGELFVERLNDEIACWQMPLLGMGLKPKSYRVPQLTQLYVATQTEAFFQGIEHASDIANTIREVRMTHRSLALLKKSIPVIKISESLPEHQARQGRSSKQAKPYSPT
jgi:hypothetical protein